jgi:carboxymethylenebutenolidase
VFYGMNPRPLSAVARACPIVGSYPEKDFTSGAAKKLGAELTRLSVPHDIKIYPRAKHSFFNNESRAYNQEASRDAWARTMQFFRTYLGTSS